GRLVEDGAGGWRMVEVAPHTSKPPLTSTSLHQPFYKLRRALRRATPLPHQPLPRRPRLGTGPGIVMPHEPLRVQLVPTVGAQRHRAAPLDQERRVAAHVPVRAHRYWHAEHRRLEHRMEP